MKCPVCGQVPDSYGFCGCDDLSPRALFYSIMMKLRRCL